jgi:hypothetical protein
MSDPGWNPTPPGWRPVQPTTPRSPGEAVWSLTRDGRVISCELQNETRVGGRYERTSSREGGNWRHAARMVVEDLKAWIDANRAALK